MRRILLLFAFCWVGHFAAFAQIPNGSTAPNFTVTDINGNVISLYSLLDQGKTVYLDVFATWCVPCWNYHNSHALRDIWEQYGPPGTDEAYVISIEGDATTSIPPRPRSVAGPGVFNVSNRFDRACMKRGRHAIAPPALHDGGKRRIACRVLHCFAGQGSRAPIRRIPGGTAWHSPYYEHVT